MTLVAHTRIKHINEAGTQTVVEEGDAVPGKVFTKDELDELKANGAVGEPPSAPAALGPDERDARIAELEKQLAAAQAEAEDAKAEAAETAASAASEKTTKK
jgi:hypothetical protein